jgi:hypothetical protein
MKQPVISILLQLTVLSWAHSADSGFRILSDRSIYVTGEIIHFTVFSLGEDPDGSKGMSTVYYMELVSPEGRSYARSKLRLDQKGVSGSMEIPRDLPSGSYYLKGYTRWMRNFGPSAYNYLGIELLNPFSTSKLPVDKQHVGMPVERPEEEVRKAAVDQELGADPDQAYNQMIELASPPGETVEYCVSVIRRGSLEKQPVSHAGVLNPEGIARSFIPETRGVSLKGKVLTAEGDSPVPYAVVYVSVLGEGRDFLCNYADSAGNFHIALTELEGSNELFVSASHQDYENLELLIEQDFCAEAIKLPSPSMVPDSAKEALLSVLSVNAQIWQQYKRIRGSSVGAAPENSDLYFYGVPTSVVYFDDYIRLPTLGEYFTEVCPQVTLQRTRHKSAFHVIGEHPGLRICDPLVMVDGVAVFDMEAVLSIAPGYIDRVEIIEAPFIRGNLTFGGIINIISRNGDMGYMDLPDSGLLLQFSFFSDIPHYGPVWQPESTRMPDVRNTLYWNPRITVNPGESKQLSFTGTLVPGSYQVVVRGYDTQGRYYESRVPYYLSGKSPFRTH